MSQMKCLICGEDLIEIEDDCEIELGIDDGTFRQYYNCPSCNSEFVCSSSSGDMIPEYLEPIRCDGIEDEKEWLRYEVKRLRKEVYKLEKENMELNESLLRTQKQLDDAIWRIRLF